MLTLRLICWLLGHVERPIWLDEMLFGDGAYSSILCARCGRTVHVGLSDADQVAHLTALIDAARPQPHPVDGFVPGDHRQYKRWPDVLRTR